jgi:hypothetical protein
MLSAPRPAPKYWKPPNGEFLELTRRQMEVDRLRLLKLHAEFQSATKSISRSRERIETSRALLRRIALIFPDASNEEMRSAVASGIGASSWSPVPPTILTVRSDNVTGRSA